MRSHLASPRQFWSQAIIVTLSLGVLLLVVLTQTEMKINQTPSLGYGIFFCVKGLAVKRGDFVSFDHHPTAYFGNISYTKRLKGLPGDQIGIVENQLFINDKPIGMIRSKTRDGKPLHPLKAKKVPEGYVFVSADHLRSYDSRYEEFGLVKQSCLRAKCFGFFKAKSSVQGKNL